MIRLNGLAVETGQSSHVGKVRSINEDSLLCRPESGLWVVSDGMGGHAAGDFASQTVVSQLASVGQASGLEDLEARVLTRLAQANHLVRRHAERLGVGSIGATVVALLLAEGHASFLWSGDSRIYRVRQGRAERMTRDHTEVMDLLDSGAITPEQARVWPRRNVITRAIGVAEVPSVDLARQQVFDQDAFCLCSDGVTEYLSDEEIRQEVGGADPQLACERIISTVLDRGARDNATVVIVSCRVVPGEVEEFDDVTARVG
jgi:serine/threonine protein phosphatase PrpC